jgi:hypothetical protein
MDDRGGMFVPGAGMGGSSIGHMCIVIARSGSTNVSQSCEIITVPSDLIKSYSPFDTRCSRSLIFRKD